MQNGQNGKNRPDGTSKNGEKNDMTGDEKGKARKEQTHNPILR